MWRIMRTGVWKTGNDNRTPPAIQEHNNSTGEITLKRSNRIYGLLGAVALASTMVMAATDASGMGMGSSSSRSSDRGYGPGGGYERGYPQRYGQGYGRGPGYGSGYQQEPGTESGSAPGEGGGRGYGPGGRYGYGPGDDSGSGFGMGGDRGGRGYPPRGGYGYGPGDEKCRDKAENYMLLGIPFDKMQSLVDRIVKPGIASRQVVADQKAADYQCQWFPLSF